MVTNSGDPLALAKIIGVLKANADSNLATDIYTLAVTLQKDLPSIPRGELIRLIETTIVELRVAAVWIKPANEN